MIVLQEDARTLTEQQVDAIADRLDAQSESEKGARVWTLREILDKGLEKPEAVIPKMAWAGRTSLLAAEEKLGKSTLLTAAAAEVSRGGEFLGRSLEPGAVLWFAEEHVGDVARRAADFGADPDRVTLAQWRTDPVAEVVALAEKLEPRLLIVDTLADIARVVSPESGSASQWSRVVRPIVDVSRRVGCATVISHHARRVDGKYRDSSEIGAAVDVILEMHRRPGTVRKFDFRGRYGTGVFAVRLEGNRYELLEDAPLIATGDEVIRFLEDIPGASTQAVIDGIGRRSSDVRDELAQLAGLSIIEDRGYGNAHKWFLNRPGSGTNGTIESESSDPSGQAGRGVSPHSSGTADDPSRPHPRDGTDGGRAESSDCDSCSRLGAPCGIHYQGAAA